MNMIYCLQGSYAFVDFDNEADADKAKNELINKDLKGLKINIGKCPKYFLRIMLC
jgi:hypothetical protein